MTYMKKKGMNDSRYSYNIGISMGATTKIVVYITTWILFASINGTEAFIGINWGRQSAQRLVPSQVVDLLLQNGVGHAKLFSSESDILEAFADSGIHLTINLYKGPTSYTDIADARKWIKIKDYYLQRCNVRMVILGNYVFLQGIKGKPFLKMAITSAKNLKQALDEAGYNDIMTNLVNVADILKPNIGRPSAAKFRDEILYELKVFVRFLKEHRAPFLIEMFPILEATRNNLSISHAFIDNDSPKNAITDVNGTVYTNAFDFTYDSFVWALTKINASDLKIMVTQVGWPTDGHEGADAANAERFYKHMLPYVASNKGTPMRPGEPIDVYVHSLTDEPKIVDAEPFARHWGIFRSNGQPKFKIDLSGQGRDIYPATIKGVMKMPRRWCVFNGDKSDMFFVRKQLDYACQKGDCTSTTAGGSCSRLTFEQNISYAFNMLFQFKFQDEKVCSFGGLARVSVTDPSTEKCVFPIEVVRGQQQNLGK